MYILLFLIKKVLFYKVVEKIVSVGLSLFLIIVLDVLSIVILVGIRRKYKFGYYVSLVFIGIIIFSNLVDFLVLIKNNLVSSLWYIINILSFIIIGYSIHKEKKYFEI